MSVLWPTTLTPHPLPTNTTSSTPNTLTPLTTTPYTLAVLVYILYPRSAGAILTVEIGYTQASAQPVAQLLPGQGVTLGTGVNYIDISMVFVESTVASDTYYGVYYT